MKTNNPEVGMVVRSAYSTIADRRVLDFSRNNVRYETLTKTGKRVVRNCLRSGWEKWCKDHDARSIDKTSMRRPAK